MNVEYLNGSRCGGFAGCKRKCILRQLINGGRKGRCALNRYQGGAGAPTATISARGESAFRAYISSGNASRASLLSQVNLTNRSH